MKTGTEVLTDEQAVERMQTIVKRLGMKGLEISPGRSVALLNLVTAIEAILNDDMQGMALITMPGQGPNAMFVSIMDNSAGPEIGFEMSGRLGGLAASIARRAGEIEHMRQHHRCERCDPGGDDPEDDQDLN